MDITYVMQAANCAVIMGLLDMANDSNVPDEVLKKWRNLWDGVGVQKVAELLSNEHAFYPLVSELGPNGKYKREEAIKWIVEKNTESGKESSLNKRQLWINTAISGLSMLISVIALFR